MAFAPQPRGILNNGHTTDKAREEKICRVTSTDIAFCFAEFLTKLEGNSAHVGSTDLDCILSVNLTLFFTIQHYTFCFST